MVSRIKILPSDVALMIIDYLDSPSMMNCREVCKSWLDVVEGNRFLFNYFLVLDENRCYTLNMLNFFSAKSNYSLKAFQLYSSTDWYKAATNREAVASNRTSRAISETLFKSRDSLKIFFHSWKGKDNLIISYFIDSCFNFTNLKSLYGENTAHSRLSVRIRGVDKGSDALPYPLAIAACSSCLSNEDRLLSFVKASALTLVHLNVNFNLSGRLELNFPNLQVLQVSAYDNPFDGIWKVPKLRVFSLTLPWKASLATNFPSSMEELWLVRESWFGGSLKRKGLDCLKKFYPKVRVFKMEFGVAFYPDEVIKMVKARKAAVKKGISVDGVKMRAIEKLILDFRSIEDETSLSKLQELVPEVVDAASASNEITIDC